MADLTRANQGRQNKALDKLIDFGCSIGVTTYRKLINTNAIINAKIEIVPKYSYNKYKYNKMNHWEQREYDKKMEQTKNEYKFYLDEDDDRSYYSVPKLVYDFYINNK